MMKKQTTSMLLSLAMVCSMATPFPAMALEQTIPVQAEAKVGEDISNRVVTGKMAGAVTNWNYAGTGTAADPYRILIKKVEGDPPNVAPNKFWGDPLQSFNVVFEQRQGDIHTGDLRYAYQFNTDESVEGTLNGRDTAGNRFRFTPYNESRANPDGTLDIGFSWKGTFSTFWKNWTFRADVQSLSNGTFQPGDKVKISYYGGYNSGFDTQSGWDTTYEIDFDCTDETVTWTTTTTLDEKGYLVLSGADMLMYGGNYKVEKVMPTPPPTPEEVKLFSPEESNYAGTGTDADPYRILVYRVPGKNPPNTAPSKFWKGVPDGPNHADLNVVFENTDDNTQTGTLLYSYQFDYSDKVPENWNEEFTKAFRFSPYTEYDNANGTLRFGHGWKGDYSTYWNDWTYKLNVAVITADAPADQQLNAGDRVLVTHTGDYLAGQTNRGTNYTVNLDSTTNTEADGYAPYVTWAHEMEVGADGFLTFSGEDMLVYGGNYKVEKAVHEHDFDTVWHQDETGHWHECACGEKSEVAAHTYGDWTVTQEPTETTEGQRTHTCTVCGYTETESIPVKPHEHNFDTVWHQDETGHWHECACGEKSEVAAHTYGDWTVTQEPTETTEGQRAHTCTVCGYTETESIPAVRPQNCPIQAQFVKNAWFGTRTITLTVEPDGSVQAPNANGFFQSGNGWKSEDGSLYVASNGTVTYTQLLEVLGGTAEEGDCVRFVVTKEQDKPDPEPDPGPIEPVENPITVTFRLNGWGQHLEGTCGKAMTVTLKPGQSVEAPFAGSFFGGVKSVNWSSNLGYLVTSGSQVSYERLAQLMDEVPENASVVFTGRIASRW